MRMALDTDNVTWKTKLLLMVNNNKMTNTIAIVRIQQCWHQIVSAAERNKVSDKVNKLIMRAKWKWYIFTLHTKTAYVSILKLICPAFGQTRNQLTFHVLLFFYSAMPKAIPGMRHSGFSIFWSILVPYIITDKIQRKTYNLHYGKATEVAALLHTAWGNRFLYICLITLV